MYSDAVATSKSAAAAHITFLHSRVTLVVTGLVPGLNCDLLLRKEASSCWTLRIEYLAL